MKVRPYLTWLKPDLRGLVSAIRSGLDTWRRKARAEAYVRIADTLASRYPLGPRARDGAARSRRLHAAASKSLAAAGFVAADPPRTGTESVPLLAGARARLRADLQRVALLAVPWIAILSALVALAVQVDPLRSLLHPQNLAARKPWRTSGDALEGATAGTLPRSGQESPFFFHTTEQDGPWVEVDLGKVRPLHSFKVQNREDCCPERAVPLVMETSTDGASWTFVARRRGLFSTWEGAFPEHDARYVRLRSERTTSLHLRQIKIY